jgi:hypothetical protein
MDAELTLDVEMQVRQIHVGKIAMVLTPYPTYRHAGTSINKRDVTQHRSV